MLAWVYLASEWVIRLTMIPIVLRRRRASAAMSWLLMVFFLPWFGLVVYLLIGRERLPRKRAARSGHARQMVRALRRLAASEAHIVRPAVSEHKHDLVAVARATSDLPILGGNAVEIVAKPDGFIDRLVADIEAATRHVHILVYIYRDDATGRRIAEALKAAAARGVTCRVLVDAVGSAPMLRRLGPELCDSGVEVVAILPVNPARLLFSRLDVRNHRKLMIIDGRTAYVGSQNIVDPDYGQKRVGAWQDLSARVQGPSVLQLQHVFLEDWYAETQTLLEDPGLFPPTGAVGDVPMQIVATGPVLERQPLRDLMVAALHEAEQRIIVTSPYLVPDEAVMAALRVAVLRGVRVDMVVPRSSDQRLASAAARSYDRELHASGVRVHLHQQGVLHAKTLTVDNAFALVGSSNFDMRSFEVNFELNLLMYGPAITAALRAKQEAYMRASVLLDSEQIAARGRIGRFLDDTARLVGPLL